MGKVKDGTPAVKATKVAKGGPVAAPKGRFSSFLANLAQVGVYKPLQGRQARIYTAVALAFIIVMGLRELQLTLSAQPNISIEASYIIPTVVGLVLGWIAYRLLQFPPFVEFLIATEAEMNKVSWTSREDLKRATTVVLVTVAVMAVFLFGVDWLWSNLLQAIGVLRFHNTSDLGSTA
ncbi:preprotein translocase subunit SecE [Tundrisphaera sp. TA3]|uniref:preprotein translocase subunit SecE n=1 Tax=Tundrisphaera sp. TA3 TaxID=3435775 RepID=UPI003EC08AC6